MLGTCVVFFAFFSGFFAAAARKNEMRAVVSWLEWLLLVYVSIIFFPRRRDVRLREARSR